MRTNKKPRQDKKQIPFIPLGAIFRKSGVGYRLIKRNNNLALFALNSDRHWEVDRIYINPANDRFGVHFPEMEAISNETQFGRDGSCTFQNFEKALRYFDELSKKPGYARRVEDSNHFDSEVDSYTTEGEIVPPVRKLPVMQTNKTDVLRLPETFRKNRLDYKLIERNDKVGFYEQYVNKIPCGYEVARIQILPEFTNVAGTHYPVREALPTNDEFGMEGSKCFFAGEPKRARQYFKALSDEIRAIENGSTDHFYTNKYSI
jgi:hypothetical protein